MPLCMPVSACVCRQTDHPQTVGTLLAEEGSERREGDGWMIHARTIDCLVQSSNDVTQAVIDLQWYRSSGQFLTLFLWRWRPIYTSCMGSAEETSHCTVPHLNCIKRTRGQCEPVWVRHYTHGFSCRRPRVMTVTGALEARRHTIGRCHMALDGRPSSSLDCQRCRNTAQVNKLRSSC